MSFLSKDTQKRILSWFIRRNGGLVRDVVDILAAYYVDCDTWDELNSNTGCTFSDNKVNMSMRSGSSSAIAYGKNIIHKGECFHWKLKLCTASETLFVGVVDDSNVPWTKWKSELWFLRCTRQMSKVLHNRGRNTTLIARLQNRIYKNGDTVELILDLSGHSGRMIYILNGVNVGCCFNKLSVEKSYRLCVGLHGAVELM